MVLGLFVVAGWLRLNAAQFLVFVCVVGGVVGYRQGRADRRSDRRRAAAQLPRRQHAGRPRERSLPRPVAPAPRRARPRPRYESYDSDDFDDDWGDDDWGSGDDWGFDDDEGYRPPRRGRHRRGDSWETDDADYI